MKNVRQSYLVIFYCCVAMVFAIFAMLITANISNAAEPPSFSWLPNSETDLAGYKIHWGPTSRQYDHTFDCQLPPTEGGRVHCTIDEAQEGNAFYAAVAYDTAGNVSDYSDELSNNAPPGMIQGYRFEATATTTIRGTLTPITN